MMDIRMTTATTTILHTATQALQVQTPDRQTMESEWDHPLTPTRTRIMGQLSEALLMAALTQTLIPRQGVVDLAADRNLNNLC